MAKKYIENIWSRSRAPEPIDGANYLTLFVAASGVMTAPTRGEYEHGYAFAAPWHARTIRTRLSKEQDCTTWSVFTTGEEPPVFVAIMAQPYGPAMALPGHQEPLRFLAPCALVASPGRCLPGENLGARRG